MFEHRHQPLLPRRRYLARVARSGVFAAALIGGSLAIGLFGYHWLCRLSWLDALLNASMILGGMGPVDPIRTTAGKWFAAAYSLFSGFALLTSVGVVLAPILHRFMHRFHLEEERRPDRRE
jgi:hypothetical protein